MLIIDPKLLIIAPTIISLILYFVFDFISDSFANNDEKDYYSAELFDDLSKYALLISFFVALIVLIFVLVTSIIYAPNEVICNCGCNCC